ncbi:MAG: hypothetical protein ACK5QC_04725 [Bacteroidota bacterium]
MSNFKHKIKSDRGICWLLLLASSIYYTGYFSKVILHLNDVLSCWDGDAIKNYYTFIYYITINPGWISFNGLNYPFGEQLVYTDCIPLLAATLKLLPFTHDYAIGILHFLIFFSHAITSVIIFKTARLLGLNQIGSALLGFSLMLLSPQLLRIDYGHFAQTFGCIIPFLIYLLVVYFKSLKRKYIVLIGVYILLTYFIHPYTGFGLSLFTIISLTLFELFINKQRIAEKISNIFTSSIIPTILFKVFMILTDTHVGRTESPFGKTVHIANIQSIFVPRQGPFKSFLEQIYGSEIPDVEGLCYMGLLFPVLIIVSCVVLIIKFKSISAPPKILFISGFMLLLFSFGIQNNLMELVNVKLNFINQFRALGRFAWFFYYSLPIAALLILKDGLTSFGFIKERFVTNTLLVTCLFVNIIDAHYYFKYIDGLVFNKSNIYKFENLNLAEKSLVKNIESKKFQAIFPIPFYQYSSEIFELDRDGFESAHLAMLLSYHTKLPLMSFHSARISGVEARHKMDLLNIYSPHHDSILSLLTHHSIACVKYRKANKPDENRLFRNAPILYSDSVYQLYEINKESFNFKLAEQNQKNYFSIDSMSYRSDSLIFTHLGSEAFYNSAKIQGYEKLFVIEPGSVLPGDYVVSFHYCFKEKNLDNIHCHFIIEETDVNKTAIWSLFNSVRRSHSYSNFFVYEQNFRIEKNRKYVLFLNGPGKGEFYIRNLLLRPERLNVYFKRDPEHPLLVNNYPF